MPYKNLCAEHIVSYDFANVNRDFRLQIGIFIYKTGKLITKSDFHLQNGIFVLQTGLSFCNLPYTKSSKEYGINYKQNIDINAFSYFCSSMDALQKWGRTKQLDMSVVDIPKDHFLQHDFDIVFTDYKIKIICSTDISGSMRKEINKLEEYLPGASHIIKLCEREL